jgi:hypothetical protein
MEDDNTELLIGQQIKLLLREILIEKIEMAIVQRVRERYPQQRESGDDR